MDLGSQSKGVDTPNETWLFFMLLGHEYGTNCQMTIFITDFFAELSVLQQFK